MSRLPWHLCNLDVTLQVRVVDLADSEAWLFSIRDELDLGWRVLLSGAKPAIRLGWSYVMVVTSVGIPRVRVVLLHRVTTMALLTTIIVTC